MQQPHTDGAVNQPKPGEAFRNFAAEERPSVREFYRQNHTHQTVEFVLGKDSGDSVARSGGGYRVKQVGTVHDARVRRTASSRRG